MVAATSDSNGLSPVFHALFDRSDTGGLPSVQNPASDGQPENLPKFEISRLRLSCGEAAGTGG